MTARSAGGVYLLMLAVLSGTLCQRLAGAAPEQGKPSASEVLVTVNGVPVTAADVGLEFYLKQVPEEATDAQKREYVERLIDRLLVQQFLDRLKIEADPEELDRQVGVVTTLIEKRGGNVEDVLAEIGLTEKQLRETLALPIAWRQFVRQTVTDRQVREYFDQHRRQLDGTRLSGAQIVKTVSADASEADWKSAESLLMEVRRKIASGETSFAEAARRHSDSPSADRGGDLGRFEFHGRIAPEMARIAFSLKPGEVSEVFRSRFGVHLLTVTDEIPGQLSAEDVRPMILESLGDELWNQQVKAERARARIVWANH